ncbi:MAG: TIR domain-containing protein [Balneolales bacterium]
MARNIFISYKYGDTLVADLNKNEIKINGGRFQYVKRSTRARDYVDELQKQLKSNDHINLGEKDGESLEEFVDETIRTQLKDKIRQSSITLVLISKGMKDENKLEKDQWVPWEVSYSLRTTTVQNRKSHKNAVLGIVLPDETCTYNWYYTENLECNSVTHLTGQLFSILNKNMFNIKEKSLRECNGSQIHEGEPSYIKAVKWSEFVKSTEYYIEKAIKIREKAEGYEVVIKLE